MAKTRLAVLGLVAILAGFLPAHAEDPPFAECLPAEASGYTVAATECQLIHSAHLGADAPFSYYVPPACTPTHKCPVLYLFHGTGGSYRYLGTKGGPLSSFELALDHAPPVDLNAVSDPWNYPASTWVPAPTLEMILVAGHNRTLPGGNGPREGMDGLWGDWNPRYGAGGDQEAYATPPPQFESYVVNELIPFVESHLPAMTGRGARASLGVSQGGFGALKLPLQHPDMFAVATSLSGGSLPVGWLARIPGIPGAPVQPPVSVPTVHLPGIFPKLQYPDATNYLVVPSIMVAYGDPAADNVYLVSEMPAAIVPNARAWEDGRQAVGFRLTSNDMIPRRVEDFSDPQGYASSQGYELLTFQTTREMLRVMDVHDVDYTYAVHPGLHGGPYQPPWYRQAFEFIWGNLLHADGTGTAVTDPDTFDYRTIREQFSIWGWSFSVDREPVEFLDVMAASCDGLTLRGTGVVTVTVPGACGTGLGGSTTFAVDLGNDQAVDEPAHASMLGVYGRTVRVTLAPL